MELTVGVTSGALGLDGHVANWVVSADDLVLVDIGSPMLRDHRGVDQLDVEAYAAGSPACPRPIVRRLVPQLLDPYHLVRGSLADVGVNLARAGLADLRPLFVDLANAPLRERALQPLTVEELARDHRQNARLWDLSGHALRW